MITVYSKPGCPKCSTLKKKLDMKGVPYDVIDDIDYMIELGLMELPILELEDGQRFNFKDAIGWVNSQ